MSSLSHLKGCIVCPPHLMLNIYILFHKLILNLYFYNESHFCCCFLFFIYFFPRKTNGQSGVFVLFIVHSKCSFRSYFILGNACLQLWRTVFFVNLQQLPGKWRRFDSGAFAHIEIIMTMSNSVVNIQHPSATKRYDTQAHSEDYSQCLAVRWQRLNDKLLTILALPTNQTLPLQEPIEAQDS